MIIITQKMYVGVVNGVKIMWGPWILGRRVKFQLILDIDKSKMHTIMYKINMNTLVKSST